MNFSSSIIVLLVSLFMSVPVLAGFNKIFAPSKISIVKNSTLNGYPNSTIGKALDSSFRGSKWLDLKADNGSYVVQFDGLIGKGFSEAVAKSLIDLMRDKMNYEFEKIKGTEISVDLMIAMLTMEHLKNIYPEKIIYDPEKIKVGYVFDKKIIDTYIMLPSYAEYRKSYGVLMSLVLSRINLEESTFSVQFVFEKNSESEFSFGWYGAENSGLKLQKIISLDKVLDFIYSNHQVTGDKIQIDEDPEAACWLDGEWVCE